MAILDWPTFVLQRRITRPSQEVSHAITNPAVFGAGTVLSSDPAGTLRLEEPFRRVPRFDSPGWRANARLLRKHGRRLAAVEIEIGPWSEADTELLILPRARHPERWSRRRLRRYFAHAHRSAEDLAHLLRDAKPQRMERAVADANIRTNDRLEGDRLEGETILPNRGG